MSLKTRLDGRSEDNDRFKIKNEEGEVLAEVELLNSFGVTLNIATNDGLYIEKPSGWSSK
jgi:hypothetical protein